MFVTHKHLQSIKKWKMCSEINLANCKLEFYKNFQINLQKAEKSMIFYNNGNSCDNNGYDVQDEMGRLKTIVVQREEERKKSSFNLICKG